MNLGLEGKTALVCASTKGLGWASAKALANEGVRVVVNGRSHEAASSRASQLPNAIGIGMDITTSQGARDLAQRAHEELGQVDILVLNGPGPQPGSALKQDEDSLRKALERLAIAPSVLIEELMPGMSERRWGRVVAISSSSVTAPLANLALSNFSRPALISLIKTMSSEVAAEGVTMNAVLPGRIETERVRQVDENTALERGVPRDRILSEALTQIPIGRLGKPEEIGAAVAYLSSDIAGFTTGTAIRVDGGAIPVL